MFGKTKDENDRLSAQQPQPQRPIAMTPAEPAAADEVSVISRCMTIVGKISGEGSVNVFGQVEGELRAVTIMVNEGARVEGDVVAEDLTIGGQVKGAIRASRVRLKSTAVVEGDIFHRSLTIEENARFEGSSKRDDSPVEAARMLAKRPVGRDEPATKIAGIEANRKTNGGAPTNGAHPGAGAA